MLARSGAARTLLLLGLAHLGGCVGTGQLLRTLLLRGLSLIAYGVILPLTAPLLDRARSLGSDTLNRAVVSHCEFLLVNIYNAIIAFVLNIVHRRNVNNVSIS